MADKHTLLMRLAGPLQSWGTDSLFTVRRTGNHPSKSGVTGLVAAAFGIPRDGDLSRISALRYGVRTDSPGQLLCDYHTAAGPDGGYVTHRYYLQDAVFVAGLESEDRGFLEEISYAVMHPVYPLFLGRKSCPPTLPLILEIRDCPLEDALRQYECTATRKPPAADIYIECSPDDPDARPVHDRPVSFSSVSRQYAYRPEKKVRCAWPDALPADADSE